MGDQLDRGNQEIEILYFLERLEREAAAAGGALHVLNGNHETMNVAGRFTYATQPAMAEFLEWHALSRLDANLRVRARLHCQACSSIIKAGGAGIHYNRPARCNFAI